MAPRARFSCLIRPHPFVLIAPAWATRGWSADAIIRAKLNEANSRTRALLKKRVAPCSPRHPIATELLFRQRQLLVDSALYFARAIVAQQLEFLQSFVRVNNCLL